MNINVWNFINNHLEDGKEFWICPNIVSNQTISPSPYKKGLDISQLNSIPIEIRDKEVVKVWGEDNKICIIWRNE